METADTPTAFRDKHLVGVWAAIPIPWDRQGNVDAGLVDELVATYASSGVHGVYTTGTDGEFHLIDLPEYRSLVDAFSDAVSRHGIAAQVGVTWLHTEGVLERMRYARDGGISAVQIAFPFWETLNDREMLGFFEDLSTALPDVALIHYNISKARRFVTGPEYRRIVEVAPNLVGTKQTGGDVAALETAILSTPQIHHFVVDPHIVPGILLGAPGTYSAAVNINSRWMMEWWADCERGDWAEATRKKIVLDQMDRDAQRLLPHLTAEPAWSKLYVRCGIAPQMPLGVRAPYLAASEEDAVTFRRLLEESYPELVYVRS